MKIESKNNTIIRTTKDGKRLPMLEVQEKRTVLKNEILATGKLYTEYEAFLGFLDAKNERVEETVYIIEIIEGL